MKVEKYFDAILAITTTTLFCLICQHGLYLAGGDSMHYYEIAEWSKRGEAVSQYPTSIPIQEPTHYTLGTALLTGFLAYIFKAEILNTYTYLNGFFLLANVLLFRYLAKRVLKDNLLSFFAALLFLFDYGTAACHIELSSEPLFMFCFFSYLHCWLNYKEKNRTIDLILLAVFSGCATVTRYIGIVLIVPVLFILFFKQKKYFKEPLIYLSIYMIFPILLFFRNIIFFGKTTDRLWTMHLLPFRKILQFGQTLVGWFSPLIYTKEFRFVGLILGGLSFIFFTKIIFHTIQNGGIKKLIFWENENKKYESKTKNKGVLLLDSIANLDFFTVFITTERHGFIKRN